MARILVLGGVSYDTIVHVDRLPQPVSQNVFPRRVHETVGSTGAGKALNLQRLGFTVDLHSMLGDDVYGRWTRDYLTRAGIAYHTDPDPAGTERHLNLMDPEGERLTIWLETGTFEPTVDAGAVERLVAPADLVVLNINNYCRRFIPTIQAHGKPVWTDLHDYDGQDPYRQEFLDAAETVFMSSTALPDYRPVMSRLVAAGKALVVCTHGKRGATALTADGRWHEAPIMPGATLVDANGAGDAFFAGYLYSYLRGASPQRCLHTAAITAGLCIGSTELAAPDMTATQVERLAAEHFDG
jgi:sugar/nucleoside kinase (ribokinase family)